MVIIPWHNPQLMIGSAKIASTALNVAAPPGAAEPAVALEPAAGPALDPAAELPPAAGMLGAADVPAVGVEDVPAIGVADLPAVAIADVPAVGAADVPAVAVADVPAAETAMPPACPLGVAGLSLPQALTIDKTKSATAVGNPAP
jgi:hypothetical protein